MVYLARTPELAVSYVETSETVPEDWLDQIVILSIDVTKLDPTRLCADTNVIDGADTREYHGVVSPVALGGQGITEPVNH